jgi:hypothetical protein
MLARRPVRHRWATRKTFSLRQLPARLLALAVLLAAVAVSPAAHSAEDEPSTALSQEWWSGQISSLPFRPAEPGKRWWEEVLRAHPTCGAFTDACRICSIGPDGPVCSNVGIACVAGEWTCAADGAPTAR